MIAVFAVPPESLAKATQAVHGVPAAAYRIRAKATFATAVWHDWGHPAWSQTCAYGTFRPRQSPKFTRRIGLL